ncbi:dynein axonemal intermediate chain 4 [Episyrphus balteatus]|uniref:dynein axonemal intermediate chain 4 n=1 Tax=Episyrphus balteatus TaxID=286459 RepID=UPI00248518D4|nr:dynein axonemal intermediate chain 4 [Episyrphus balteatus]
MKKSTISRISFHKGITKSTSKIININKDDKDDISSLATTSSSSSATIPKSTTRYSKELALALQRRKDIQVIDNNKNVTPKPIESEKSKKDFQELQQQADEFFKTIDKKPEFVDITLKRTSLGGALRVSMNDIVHGISQGLFILYEQSTQSTSTQSKEVEGLGQKEQKFSPFIKIYLRQTKDILLFEQRSTTVPFGTEDAERVDKENKAYDYVTKGKGRLRRKADSEAQTTNVLYKSRDANTDTIRKINAASYVSNFDMFDTYEQLQPVKSSLKMDDSKTLDVMTYKVGGIDPCDQIGRLAQFDIAQMVTQRILAGNVFKEQQRRFRNMFMPDPLSMEVEYLYRTDVLWVLWAKSEDKERHAVSCMSWCPSNGDILAVGYGVYTCAPNYSPKRGYVCIWSIKNPVNPEKLFEYNSSVVSVEFSPYRPQLLAIGLYDGSVEVRDITTERDCTVAISQRETSPGYEPVTDIKWIPLDAGETANIEPFLTVSQDASVMKYRVINSPYLLGYCHAVLNRVEGSPEGLPVQRPWNTLEAVRHTQCLGITLDPIAEDIFYVISNEGVIYKCSTNYPQQHLSLWQTHEGAVYSMEFSPWSPKLFLTCGDDWCIRIWIDGIFKPLITLTSKLSPINCACWSKTHSTVIVSINRKTVDVWDIRRSTLKPMSSKRLERSYLTMTKFSNCGRSIAVGNERGAVYVCALEDMPFPPHFQYEELETAIFKALMPYPEIVTELKSLGYFGYPKKKRTD